MAFEKFGELFIGFWKVSWAYKGPCLNEERGPLAFFENSNKLPTKAKYVPYLGT